MSQDFHRAKLQGKSLKNQNLTGADFSFADIRGTNFTNAILVGVNFSHVKAGLQLYWLIILVIAALLLLALSGFISTYACFAIVELKFYFNFFWFAFNLLTLAVFSAVTIFQGLEAATGAIAVIYVCAVIVILAISPNNPDIISPTVALTIGTISLAGAIAGITILALGAAMIKILLGNRTIILSVVMALLGSMAGALSAVVSTNRIILTTPIALCLFLLGAYIGEQAYSGNKKYSIIKTIAIIICSQKSTNFCGADLTDANFSQASLKCTDFRKAVLTRILWYKSKQLNFVRPGKSYLENSQLIQLLVTGEGQKKNFDRQNLRGVNLQGANLAETSFIAADLSESNLQDADLSRAKLVQTQLEETNLSGATLTGATIENWGITNYTNLDGVKCKYVFMRSPTKEDQNPYRKPDNWNESFADGDFADFIKPVVDTLDLYHNQDVDPRAIAISFKQLAENNPEAELRIVGMEVRGENKFLLRAKTARIADKSELSAEYFTTYNQIKGLPEREVKLLLAEKDHQIRRLENMIYTALERPSFYAETYYNQGDTTMTGDRNIYMGDGNYNERIQGNYIQGNYSAAPEKQSLSETAAEIQQLLQQLEQSYPSNTTTGKMTIATEAIKYIDSHPTVAQRILSAVKVGGVQALAQFLNHPAATFVISALEDWHKTKGN